MICGLILFGSVDNDEAELNLVHLSVSEPVPLPPVAQNVSELVSVLDAYITGDVLLED